MEGFWTIKFNGVEGFGTGVVTLIAGEVFGGDLSFLYIGTYSGQDGMFKAQVKVTRFAPGLTNVMGRDEFDLELTGLEMIGAKTPQSLHIEGRIPGTGLILKGSLKKQRNLPSRE